MKNHQNNYNLKVTEKAVIFPQLIMSPLQLRHLLYQLRGKNEIMPLRQWLVLESFKNVLLEYIFRAIQLVLSHVAVR